MPSPADETFMSPFGVRPRNPILRCISRWQLKQQKNRHLWVGGKPQVGLERELP
jgi:hypothetical protein